MVIYYSFLPEIATADERDGVSTRGWAFGYLGGGLAPALQLAVYVFHDSLGLSTANSAQIAFAASGRTLNSSRRCAGSRPTTRSVTPNARTVPWTPFPNASSPEGDSRANVPAAGSTGPWPNELGSARSRSPCSAVSIRRGVGIASAGICVTARSSGDGRSRCRPGCGLTVHRPIPPDTAHRVPTLGRRRLGHWLPEVRAC